MLAQPRATLALAVARFPRSGFTLLRELTGVWPRRHRGRHRWRPITEYEKLTPKRLDQTRFEV